MTDVSWSDLVEKLISLQEQASQMDDAGPAEYEHRLDRVEGRLGEMASGYEVRTMDDVVQALRMARDIASIEALAPLRSNLTNLMENVLGWFNRGLNDDLP